MNVGDFVVSPRISPWSVALGLFVGGALALAWGAAVGWSPLAFRVFYALGAVINVPFLAAGQLYLIIRRRTADIVAKIVSLLAAFRRGRGAVRSSEGIGAERSTPPGVRGVRRGTPAYSPPSARVSRPSSSSAGRPFGLVRVLQARRTARKNSETIPGMGRRIAGLALLATGTVMPLALGHAQLEAGRHAGVFGDTHGRSDPAVLGFCAQLTPGPTRRKLAVPGRSLSRARNACRMLAPHRRVQPGSGDTGTGNRPATRRPQPTRNNARNLPTPIARRAGTNGNVARLGASADLFEALCRRARTEVPGRTESSTDTCSERAAFRRTR